MAFPRIASFKSHADFLARLDELGIDLPCDPSIADGSDAALARPIELRDRTIGNRFCILPMEGWDGTSDGAHHTAHRGDQHTEDPQRPRCPPSPTHGSLDGYRLRRNLSEKEQQRECQEGGNEGHLDLSVPSEDGTTDAGHDGRHRAAVAAGRGRWPIASNP